MLLGISKKEFSQANRLGYGPWVNAEETGRISPRLILLLDPFCQALINPLAQAVVAIGQFTDRDLSDITLLTLGSTLQGGRNNTIGSQAASGVLTAIRRLLTTWITFETDKMLHLKIPSGDEIEISVGSDPDIQINRGLGTSSTPLIAIEIKGGGDVSNAHNRAGEAEKSQIKAEMQGYQHRWTIIRMQGVDRALIQSETPSSTMIFEAAEILDQDGIDWVNFKQSLLSMFAIPS